MSVAETCVESDERLYHGEPMFFSIPWNVLNQSIGRQFGEFVFAGVQEMVVSGEYRRKTTMKFIKTPQCRSLVGFGEITDLTNLLYPPATLYQRFRMWWFMLGFKDGEKKL